LRFDLDIGDLTCAEDQAQRIGKGIHCGVHFGAQSAARSPDRLRAFFFGGVRGITECLQPLSQ